MGDRDRARRAWRIALIVCIASCAVAAALPHAAGAAGGMETTIQDDWAFDSGGGGTPPSGDPVENMRVAKGLGVDGIRIFAHWQLTVPSNGASDPSQDDQKRCGLPPAGAVGDHPENYYRFDGLLEQINNAKSTAAAAGGRPIKVTVTLDDPIPCWASLDHSNVPGGPGYEHGCKVDWYGCSWRPDPAIYAKWALALARTLGGRVDRWSPWNEPNLTEHLDGPGRVSLIYRKLWFTAYEQIHDVAGLTAPFYFSETAYRPHPNTPNDFIREQFCETTYSSGDSAYPSCPSVPAQVNADQLSFHNYVKQSEWPIDNKTLLGEIDDLLAELHSRNRAVLIDYTAEDESGVHVCTPADVLPDDCEADQFSEDKQADNLNCMQESAWKQDRLKLFAQYLLQDPPDGHGGDFFTGLRRRGSAYVDPDHANTDPMDPNHWLHVHEAGASRPSLHALYQPVAAHRLDSGKLDAWGGWLKPPVPSTIQFVGYTGAHDNPTIVYRHTMTLGDQGYFHEDLTDAPQGLNWMTIGPNGLKSREVHGGECWVPTP